MDSSAGDRRGHAPVYLHQLYPDPPPQRPFLRRELFFFCVAFKWCFLFFLAVVTCLLLLWMFYHPVLPRINVASATMSNVSISAAGVAADCNITLILSNPNLQLAVVYDRMEILLIYASQEVLLLSHFHQPPIVQPKHSHTTFRANLGFSSVNLGNGAVSAMKQDFDNGSLGFEIKVFSVIKYRKGRWKTKSRFMRAYCGGVSFGFTSSGRSGIFLNPYQECEVYVYSK